MAYDEEHELVVVAYKKKENIIHSYYLDWVDYKPMNVPLITYIVEDIRKENTE